MKKLLILSLLFSSTANADFGWEVLAPAIVGSAIVGAIASQPTQPRYYAPPVVYQPVQPYGYPRGYHYETFYDPYLGSYRTVLVPN